MAFLVSINADNTESSRIFDNIPAFFEIYRDLHIVAPVQAENVHRFDFFFKFDNGFCKIY